MKTILSIDGGGVLGIGPATFMAEWEQCQRHSLCHPDAFAGTSVGSILACAAAASFGGAFKWALILNIFKKYAPVIFRKPSLLWRMDPRKPRYDGTGLMEALTQVFGDLRMCDLAQPCFVVAMDYTRGQPKIWDIGDRDFVRDVVAASCSAPTFFPPRDGLVDGGLVANSPAMVAIAGAVAKLKWPLQELRVLSLGTNGDYWRDPKVCETTNRLQWVDLLLSHVTRGNEELAEFQARTILEGRHLRVEPVLARDYKLDDLACMPEYSQIWKGLFRSRVDEVTKFLEADHGNS